MLFKKLVLLLCFLPLPVFSVSDCQSSFTNTPRSKKTVLSKKSSKSQPLKTVISENSLDHSFLINSIFRHIVKNQQSGRLTLQAQWKNKLKEHLPHFNRFELLRLFQNLVNLKNTNSEISYEKSFLRLLEKHSTSLLPSFNKKQLMEIIWFFVQMEIKPPHESFVKTWRKSAEKIKNEFSPHDRYGLYRWFRSLKIPPYLPKNIPLELETNPVPL